MTDSFIVQRDGRVTTFVGPDATNLFRAISLRSALRMYGLHKIRASRHIKPMWMLEQATHYTGRIYKRGQYEQAANDMTTWIELMKSALPVETES